MDHRDASHDEAVFRYEQSDQERVGTKVMSKMGISAIRDVIVVPRIFEAIRAEQKVPRPLFRQNGVGGVDGIGPSAEIHRGDALPPPSGVLRPPPTPRPAWLPQRGQPVPVASRWVSSICSTPETVFRLQHATPHPPDEYMFKKYTSMVRQL